MQNIHIANIVKYTTKKLQPPMNGQIRKLREEIRKLREDKIQMENINKKLKPLMNGQVRRWNENKQQLKIDSYLH